LEGCAGKHDDLARQMKAEVLEGCAGKHDDLARQMEADVGRVRGKT